jgi:CheY-like chemotaxis protein
MHPSRSHAPVVVLIAEDDLGDQILIEEALQSSKVPKSLQIVDDGEQALEYAFRSGRYSAPGAAPRPDLILLDLNMPRMGGKEVLARLKADASLQAIPVVAFTTSGREEDIAQCYQMGVNSYVQKPTDFDQFQRTLQGLEHYWLEVSLFAPRSD